jgi:hypothetical protein
MLWPLGKSGTFLKVDVSSKGAKGTKGTKGAKGTKGTKGAKGTKGTKGSARGKLKKRVFLSPPLIIPPLFFPKRKCV